MTASLMPDTSDVTPTADCASCPHRTDRLERGRCTPGDVCVRAMSGRQIARFFSVNPDLAGVYAGDAFWERRAIAARYLSQRRLLEMLDDPDEVVRRVLAYRLPVAELSALVEDPDREVRITVADRLPVESLGLMCHDNEAEVRRVVAERIAGDALGPLLRDSDWRVRFAACQRAPLDALAALPEDADEDVRACVHERLAALRE